MGAVRVTARLTNAGDETLVRRGVLQPHDIRTCEVEALVDTGAVRTVLPQEIATRLGLAIDGQLVVRYTDGRRETANVTEPVRVERAGRHTAEETVVLGDDVLIGQTILEKLDLFVDCDGRRLIPNPAHPDYPVSRV